MLRIRTIDIVWLLFLGALAVLGMGQSRHSVYEWLALLALGGFQIFESQLGVAEDRVAAGLAISFKLTTCYLLVWETGGIESSYYLIFLLPIVSAASLLGLWGTLLVTAASSALYLSFLVYVWQAYYVPPEGQRELTVRILFFFLSAILVNRLAAENRLKTESLARANRELSEAQDEVRRSERLAALGQLSAGLAHEIRNPLGVISASAELLSNSIARDNEVAREVAGFIRSEVGRTNELVSRFLDFARPSALERTETDLNEVVNRAVSQFHETLDGGSEVKVRQRSGELPKIFCDARLIESAVANLLANGCQAMPSGGVIEVTTSRNGSMAQIEVADQGAGIPEEELENIFNPFFTTKPRGVGLGLAMVSKFVDAHGGRINVTSRKGHGSRFRILLPIGRTA